MKAIRWHNDCLLLLDQRLLPEKISYVECSSWRCVRDAIKEMVVRGAPAIGVAAAYGIVLAAEESREVLEEAAKELALSRPTAINLSWAITRMMTKVAASRGVSREELKQLLLTEANDMACEDIEVNKKIGKHGAQMLPEKANILTYCNTGFLATAGFGTALGVVRFGVTSGKQIKVYVCETRPYLQGARLTAWELVQEQIPAILVTDNMAGLLMHQQKIDLVLVGADRVTANGDIANKIGTYTLAVLAKAHNIPFYVAAPWSTFDTSLPDGNAIPIEERPAHELALWDGKRIAPADISIYNPSFDITPASLISALVTERGIIHNPDNDKIKKLQKEAVREN